MWCSSSSEFQLLNVATLSNVSSQVSRSSHGEPRNVSGFPSGYIMIVCGGAVAVIVATVVVVALVFRVLSGEGPYSGGRPCYLQLARWS